MTKTLAGIVLFASLVMNATLLIFLAGVIRRVMNEMDGPAAQQFLVSLVRHSKKSPFMLTALNIPFIGALPYFYFYGFADHWLLAGLAVWLVAGSIAKAIKLPVYKAVATLETHDTVRLRDALHRMNATNVFQAILNTAAVLVAAIQFAR